MTVGTFRFDRFQLDPRDRLLSSGDQPVELNSRYFDALLLLVRHAGTLVSKDRFLDEVWRGVPVTDEALTQCVKTLRRQLGDSANSPRFIETVPKHGYRFIAPVELVDAAPPSHAVIAPDHKRFDARRLFLLGAAGTVGGGIAGLIGGLFYGFAGAAQPLQPGIGAASVLLVLVCLTIIAGLIGGAAVGFGVAAASLAAPRWQWSMLGGAAGGLIVGAFAKLLGLDAFNLLLGQSPGDIAGAAEGAGLGAAVGLGAWLGQRSGSLRATVASAAVAGGAAGVAITALGGQLMGGSLDQLARHLPYSRLRLDHIGALAGEAAFGPASQIITGGLEGALFGACVAAAMLLARRSLDAE